jgi:hypothetical protein
MGHLVEGIGKRGACKASADDGDPNLVACHDCRCE